MNEEIAMVILPLASPRVPGVSRRGAKLCTSRRVLLGGAGVDDYSTESVNASATAWPKGMSNESDHDVYA